MALYIPGYSPISSLRTQLPDVPSTPGQRLFFTVASKGVLVMLMILTKTRMDFTEGRGNPGVEAIEDAREEQVASTTSKQVKYNQKEINDRVKIIDIETQDYLELPFTPKEVSVDPHANWNAFNPIGRNNAGYHYGGGDDTIKFEIDWHSEAWDKQDVIKKCRWLERLSKTDGYGKPRLVHIMWGNGDRLFAATPDLEPMTWIVFAAPYELMDFNRGMIANKDQLQKMIEETKNPDVDVISDIDGKGNYFIRTHLHPTQAYQHLVLKRVTNKQLLYEDIMGYYSLDGVSSTL